MLIKVDGGYLDFNDQIEVEKQVKLFEDIASSDGDFSYAFKIERTSNNTNLLCNPMPDVLSKPVYQKIPATLLSDEGADAYEGYLRIERISTMFECSFFSGNNNWFGMLSGPMQDIDWSEFDVDQTEVNISLAISDTSGVVFPTIDNGLLDKRGFPLLKVEDFVAGIHIKDAMQKIFQHHSIKLAGELLDDPHYKTAITLKNAKNKTEIEARSCFVFTNSSANPNDSAYHKMTWTDETTDPYFDGSANLFDLTLDRYTADVKMKVRVNLIINQSLGIAIGTVFKMAIYVNGVLLSEKVGPFGTSEVQSYDAFVTMEAGDYLEIYTWNNAVFWDDPITNATLKITPSFIYKSFGSSVVPSWTQQQYVSNVMRMFCTLASFNSKTQTLTLNLFEKIKEKTPIDLSPYISSTEVDYVEFISAYGKKTLFTYNELETDLKTNFLPYSKGFISVDNDFLNDEQTALESDFTQPVSYLNPIFDASMEKTNLVELEEEIEVDITAVTDSGTGEARFAVSEDVFALSDLVRVTNSTNANYNGDYMVISLGAGYIELSGVAFDTNATAKVAKMNFVYNDSDSVFVLHHVPLYTVSKFSGLTSYRFENTDYQTMAYAFFNLFDTNRTVNDDFINSLAFSEGDYQRTMIQQYFNLFSRVLNDPVKLLNEAYLPHNIFRKIDFLRPVTVKTIDTSNMYYVNRVSGYGHCVIELIKLP